MYSRWWKLYCWPPALGEILDNILDRVLLSTSHHSSVCVKCFKLVDLIDFQLRLKRNEVKTLYLLLQHPGNCLLHLLGLFLLVGGAVGGGCLATAAIVTTNFGQSRNRETAAPNVTEPPRMSGEGHAQLRTGESRPLYLSGNLNLSFCHFYLFLGVVWIKKIWPKVRHCLAGGGGVCLSGTDALSDFFFEKNLKFIKNV